MQLSLRGMIKLDFEKFKLCQSRNNMKNEWLTMVDTGRTIIMGAEIIVYMYLDTTTVIYE